MDHLCHSKIMAGIVQVAIVGAGDVHIHMIAIIAIKLKLHMKILVWNGDWWSCISQSWTITKVGMVIKRNTAKRVGQ